MRRRAAIRKLAQWASGLVLAAQAGGSSLPNRGMDVVRLATGWVQVTYRGETLISISPRFAAEYPVETLHLITKGYLP